MSLRRSRVGTSKFFQSSKLRTRRTNGPYLTVARWLVGRLAGLRFWGTPAIRCCRSWVRVPLKLSRMPQRSRAACRNSEPIFPQRCGFMSDCGCHERRACRECRKPTKFASICMTERLRPNATPRWRPAQRTGRGPRLRGFMSTTLKWSQTAEGLDSPSGMVLPCSWPPSNRNRQSMPKKKSAVSRSGRERKSDETADMSAKLPRGDQSETVEDNATGDQGNAR